MELFAGLSVAEPQVQRRVKQFVSSQGRSLALKFPFGNPVSIEASHVDIVKSRAYLVADKSDGVRACLILCQSEGMRCAVLCDRSGNMYGVAVQCDAVYFEGTMLDAEVVQTKDGGSWKLLVFDGTCVAGYSYLEFLPLHSRLEVLGRSLGPLQFLRADVTLVTKTMFQLGDPHAMAALGSHVASLDYATDGYILTPDNESVAPAGTAPLVFKIKESHTIDFLWSGDMLWFGDTKDLYPVTHLDVQFQKEQLSAVRNDTIVEMTPQTDKQGCVVLLHFFQTRPDKTTPNSYFTVKRTLQSIKDAITLSSLLQTATP